MIRATNRKLDPPEEFSADFQAKSETNNFYFIQGADTQLGLIYNWGPEGYGHGPEGMGKYPESNWDEELELCKKSVEILNSLTPRPAFFVVCGDLVDAFPDKFPEVRARQEKDLKEVYSKLSPEIPMICVCGNHDVGNAPTKETIETYKTSFGDDYFSFYKNCCCFIVINSQFYENSIHVPDLYAEHEQWLASELKKAKSLNVNHVVIFQHIPWFVKEADEDKFYFNVEKELRKTKLDQFYEAGVRKIFCGHFHRNAGGFYKDLEVVVTSAIGCQIGPDTHGMRVVRVNKDGITHHYHPLDNFPLKVTL